MLADTVRQRVMQLRDLPSLPEVAARVLQVVDNPRSSAADLGRAISLDPALTARLLRLANSALYGYAGRIGTAVQAVTILGFAQVRSLVLTVSVLDVFLKTKGKEIIPHREFWQHCIVCAVAARTLARRKRLCPPEEAFVAGLLHDLGKVVLATLIPQQYHEAVILAAEQGKPLAEAEEETLGFTHATVGGWAVAKWRLPEALVGAVERHHQWVDAGPNAGLTRCVFLANKAIGSETFGWTGDGLHESLDPEFLQSIGMDLLELETLPEEIAEDFAAACQLLDVAGAGREVP